MSTPVAVQKFANRTSEVVSKAVVRVADRLEINNRELAKIIGVSEATASRLKGGSYTITAGKKEFELSVLLTRLYRSLDAIVGGEDRVAQAWMRNANTALSGKPIELVQEVTGLTDVIRYLDSRRAPV